MKSLAWQKARERGDAKLLPRTGELYVLARSRDRVGKERAMRRRQIKKLWGRLAELKGQAPSWDALLLKLGASEGQSPSAWRLINVQVARDGAMSYRLLKTLQ